MTDALSTSNHRQRIVLRVGAVYDAGFGVPMLAVPAMATELLKLPAPDPQVIWIRLLGICLISLGLIYYVMSRNPERYLGIIPVILLGKAASVVFYLTYVFAYGASRTFILFAVLDVIMFSLHVWALGPGGSARVREALKVAPLASA
jgi:hypothetical protein